MPYAVNGPDGLADFARSQTPVSDWLLMTQDRVTAFAECTGDSQWIHVDETRARPGPYGGTIAHGFLTLALITSFWESTVVTKGFSRTVNYGVNRVRFPAPLPVGRRIRAHFAPLELVEVPDGLQMAMQVTIECEGSPKPVCVAETLVRYYP